MNHEGEAMFNELENDLCQLAPLEPRSGAADAAYEAGRLAALQGIGSRLALHRLATAASLLVALGAGLAATLAGGGDEPRGGPLANNTEAIATTVPIAAAAPVSSSPVSYLKLREAVMRDGGFDLDRLPSSPSTADPMTPPPPPVTPAATLRRGGLDL